MANLAASLVTTLEVWKGGGTNSRKFLYKEVQIVFSTTSGGLTNLVPASVFGLSSIWGGANALVISDANGTRYEVRPSIDRQALLFYVPNTATPADISSVSGYTVRLTVWGKD